MDSKTWRERVVSSLNLPNYDELLNEALSHVPNEIDKRQGSVVHMILASICMVLAEIIMESAQLHLEGNPVTSTGENLELQGEGVGVYRKEATPAQGILVAEPRDLIVPNGNRFSTKFTETNVLFTVTDTVEYESQVAYRVIANDVGEIGNNYIGEMLAVDFVNGLDKAYLVEIDIAGTDLESDEEFRERVLNKQSQQAFGGNVAYYKEIMSEYSYIGELQVYPVWNGSGTVKLVATDKSFNKLANTVLTEIKEDIDPIIGQGKGLGKAPIGHTVTITTPEIMDISVKSKLTLTSTATPLTVQRRVEEEIEKYVKEVQKTWGDSDLYGNYQCTLYHAKIISAILNVPEVLNVENLTLNGETGDLELIETSARQEIPRFKEFVML